MPKEKLSITVDRAKLDRAHELVNARSVSDLIDLALTRLIGDALEQRHVAGYQRLPQDADEIAWSDLPRDAAAIADDVDWAALYGIER